MPCTCYILFKDKLTDIIQEKPKVAIILQTALSKAIYRQENYLAAYQMRERRAYQLEDMRNQFKIKNRVLTSRKSTTKVLSIPKRMRYSIKEDITSTMTYIRSGGETHKRFIHRKSMYYSSDEEDINNFRRNIHILRKKKKSGQKNTPFEKSERRRSFNWRNAPMTNVNSQKSKKFGKFEKIFLTQRRSFSRLIDKQETDDLYEKKRRQSFPSYDNKIWHEINIRQGII